MPRTLDCHRALVFLAVGALFACSFALSSSTTPSDPTTSFRGNDLRPSASSLAITDVIDMTGNPIYVGGQTFQVQVSARNTGTTNLKSWCIYLTFGGYSFLSAPAQNFPGTYGPGTTFTATIIVTVSTTATTQNPVTISANAYASEEFMPVLVEATPVSITKRIQSQANVSITSIEIITPRSAPGPYVAGETMSLTITFGNTGGTSATVDATISAGTYTGLGGMTNPPPVTVAAGSTSTQNFNIPITEGATTANITITATWTGTEAISDREISGGPNTVDVNIKAQAALAITSITWTSNNGTYVAGMTFVVRVSLNNPAVSAKALAVTAALAGLVAGVTANASASKTISGGSHIDFLITIAAGTATQALAITATASGSEEITARLLSAGPSYAMNINIKARAALAITGFTLRTGNGTYVAGTVFVVRVSLFNPTTSTKARSVAAPLSFGGATGLSTNTSVSKTISGNGFIDLLIMIAAGAPSQPIVTITTTVTGYEEYSNRALGPLTSTLNITIQSQANIVIDTVAANVSIIRPGRWVMAVVNLRNTGGAAVNLGTIALTLTGNGSSYAGSQTAVNVTMGSLFIPGNGRLGAQILFYVSPDAADKSVIWVNATFSGTEAISGAEIGNPYYQFCRICNSSGAVTPARITVVSDPGIIFSFVIVGGRTTFVRGYDSFVVRATVDNSPATTNMTSASISLSFGSAVNYNVNATYTGQFIHAGAVASYSFLVTVTATATLGSVNVQATLNGFNPSPLVKTSQATITTYKPSNVVLTAVTLQTGNGTYVGGQAFAVRLTFTNVGAGSAGLWVSASLNYNGATGLSSNGSVVKTVPANATTTIDFLVSITAGVASQPSVTIGATWSGAEQYSGRLISGSSGTDTLIAIKAQAALTIGGHWCIPDNPMSPCFYAAGTTMHIYFSISNPATSAKALSVTASLSFGSASILSTNVSASKTISGNDYFDFPVTIDAGAASQEVLITVTTSGSEEITGRTLSAGPSPAFSIAILAQANLSITGFTWKTGNGTYVAGTVFVVHVALYNSATAARARTVTAPLTFGGATGISANGSISRSINGSGYIDFLITIAAGAPSQPSVTITTTVTGTEEWSNRALGPLTSTLNITIQARDVLEITSLAITSPRAAPGPYFAGETFTLRITFRNTRSTAATVDATIDDGTYAGLSWNDPTAITVNAGSTQTQYFTVTVAANATIAAVTITATWNGTEQGTGNPLSGDSPADTMLVNIQTSVTPENMAPIARIVVNASAWMVSGGITFASNSTDVDGTIVSWQWDFGDGTVDSGATCVHVYSTSGTFTVVLRVVDDKGGTGSTSVTVTIAPLPPAGDPSALQDAAAASMYGIGALSLLVAIGLATKSFKKRRALR